MHIIKKINKLILLLLTVLVILPCRADEQYLFIKPQTKEIFSQEIITSPPNSALITDASGKISFRQIVPPDIFGIWGKGAIVNNFEQLQAATLNTNVPRIILGSDIVITSNITIPRTHSIVFNGYRFKEASNQNVYFWGNVVAGREQIFQDWEASDIKGPFNGTPVMPEWWGLQDGHHDIAINCAISSYVPAYLGVVVSLGSGPYNISSPLDLSASIGCIKGTGDGRTRIDSTSHWSKDSFIACPLWGAGLNHSSLVWLGNGVAGVQTFRTGIEGVTLNGYNASIANPTKRISCISSKGCMEENTFIRNVGATLFTGVGIGFPVHSNVGMAVINGLIIEGAWITQGMKRDAYPVYFEHHTVVARLSDFTIDAALPKVNSLAADIPPTFVMDWPRYGIIAKGLHLNISDGHIEGVQVGIFIEQSNGISNIDVERIDVNHLMRGNMVYYDEPIEGYTVNPTSPPSLKKQIQDFPPNARRTRPFLDHYSAAILIGQNPIINPVDGLNLKDSCTLKNIASIGQCDYLLRDCVYGIHKTAFGQGQLPNTATATLPPYFRTNSFGKPTNPSNADPPKWVAGSLYYGVPLETPPPLPKDKVYFSILE